MPTFEEFLNESKQYFEMQVKIAKEDLEDIRNPVELFKFLRNNFKVEATIDKETRYDWDITISSTERNDLIKVFEHFFGKPKNPRYFDNKIYKN